MKKLKKSSLPSQKEPMYILKLYVAGKEQNSQIARANLKTLCSEYLDGRCTTEEVDVLTDFAAALKDRVYVTPTLILVAPEPRVVVVGNLGHKEKVISALRLGLKNGT